MKNQPSNLFTPPDIISFLKEQYWSINEAAHVLTGWPNDNLQLIYLSIPSDEVQQTRTFFYIPNPYILFDPKNFGTKFHKIYLLLKKSIEDWSLNSTLGYYGGGDVRLVSPTGVLLWALENGIPIPYEIQKAKNAFQQSNQKIKISTWEKVQRKIIAQCILEAKPNATITITEITHHELMTNIGSTDNIMDKERKIIWRAVRELFDPVDKRNRNCIPTYIPRAISEVIKREQSGAKLYQFPYLKCAIETIVRARTSILGDEFMHKKSLKNFYSDILQDPVMKLYLDGSSDLINDFVRCVYLATIRNYYPSFQSWPESMQFEWPHKDAPIKLITKGVVNCIF